MSQVRDHQEIDLLQLLTKSGTEKWNFFLTRAQESNDIDGLMKTLYGIQVGMTRLAKLKKNTPEINAWYARLHRSIELTAKRIIKKLNPMPTDTKEHIAMKRKRDQEFARFLRGSSF